MLESPCRPPAETRGAETFLVSLPDYPLDGLEHFTRINAADPEAAAVKYAVLANEGHCGDRFEDVVRVVAPEGSARMFRVLTRREMTASVVGEV